MSEDHHSLGFLNLKEKRLFARYLRFKLIREHEASFQSVEVGRLVSQHDFSSLPMGQSTYVGPTSMPRIEIPCQRTWIHYLFVIFLHMEGVASDEDATRLFQLQLYGNRAYCVTWDMMQSNTLEDLKHLSRKGLLV
jgi:hypothetical protein